MQVREDANGNKIYVGEKVSIADGNVKFNARAGRNILFLEGNLKLGKSVINFNGSGSVVFLSANKHPYHFRLMVHSNQAVYFGKNNFINRYDAAMQLILSEQKHFLMGSNCTVSFNTWVRNSDPHLIYSTETKERLNPTRSVFIGDHVWIGQFATILKGTHIGSGSIIGANAVVSGKIIPSNTIWAGNPARQIKDKIFWAGRSVHNWKDAETKKYAVMPTDIYTYERDGESLSFDKIDRALSACRTAEDKMNYLLELSKNAAKNRFAI